MNQPLLEEIAQSPDAFGIGNCRIGPVELVEPDRLDAEATERLAACLLQVLRPAVEAPLQPVAGVATFGGYKNGVGPEP